MPARRYMEEMNLVAMLAAKRSEVNLVEQVTCIPVPSANTAVHSGSEIQRRCHQKSKTRVSVFPLKEFMSSKFFFLFKKRFFLLQGFNCKTKQ